MFEGFAPVRDAVKSPYGDFPEYHGYNFAGSAIRIAPAIYVVSAGFWIYNATGTFMIVGRNRGGRFQTLWNVKDLAEKHYAQGDEIGRSGAAVQSGATRTGHWAWGTGFRAPFRVDPVPNTHKSSEDPRI